MICPHCQANLLYRERSGRKCSRCKREFALEPKQNSFRLHDIRFKKLVEKLSVENTLYYTPEQLRYQAARKVIPTLRKPNSLISLGLIVVGWAIAGYIISGFLASQSIVRLLVGLVILVGGVWYGLGRAPLGIMKPRQFWNKVIERWTQVYGKPPTRLLSPDEIKHMRTEQSMPEPLRAILVCPEREVLACLQANRLPEELGLGLLPDKPPFSLAEESILAAAQAWPELPVLVLHDAGPDGVFLADRIKKAFGLSDQHRLIDLGLQPRHVMQYNLVHWGQRPPIRRWFKLGELIRSGRLNEQEVAWLRWGNYSPILLLSPKRLTIIVTNALERNTSAGVYTPDQRARTIGFMSWPELT